jgi:hypothetical protein
VSRKEEQRCGRTAQRIETRRGISQSIQKAGAETAAVLGSFFILNLTQNNNEFAFFIECFVGNRSDLRIFGRRGWLPGVRFRPHVFMPMKAPPRVEFERYSAVPERRATLISKPIYHLREKTAPLSVLPLVAFPPDVSDMYYSLTI